MKVLYIIPGEESGNSMIFARRQINSLNNLGVISFTFYLRSRLNPVKLFSEYLRFRKCLYLKIFLKNRVPYVWWYEVSTRSGVASTLLRLSTQQTYLSSMVNFVGKYMEPFEIIINSIITTKGCLLIKPLVVTNG